MLNQYAHVIFRKFDLLVFVLLFYVTSSSFAMDVTLQWDANTEIDRAGYRIYYDIDTGPPYDGAVAAEDSSPIDVKIADVEVGDTARYTVTGLNDDETYFFVVTAYNKRSLGTFLPRLK